MMAAARVSIGMLKVISTITLQTVSAYNLKRMLWRDDFEACLERGDELAESNRHFSFFGCPVAESEPLRVDRRLFRLRSRGHGWLHSAWRSSAPRLRPAGCCRWVPAAGDC